MTDRRRRDPFATPVDQTTPATAARRGRRQPGARPAGTRTLAVAVGTNLAAAALKVAGFVLTGSVALLAEAIRSLAGGATQSVLLGSRVGPEAEVDPAGVERASSFRALVVGLVLTTIGAGAVVVLAIVGLDDAEPLLDPTWAVAALAGALVVEGLSLRTALREADRARGSATRRQFLRRTTSPVLPLVLHDRLAAMAGLLLAAAGIGAAVATDDSSWDRFAAMAVAGVMALVVVGTVREVRRVLVGAGASPREDEALRAAIEIDPDVVGIVDLQTRYLGPEDLLVGAKVELQHDLTLVEVADTVHRIERHVRIAVPAARHVYLQADVDADHRVAASYVAEHSGHIDPADPDYAQITGTPMDPDDDIWTE